VNNFQKTYCRTNSGPLRDVETRELVVFRENKSIKTKILWRVGVVRKNVPCEAGGVFTCFENTRTHARIYICFVPGVFFFYRKRVETVLWAQGISLKTHIHRRGFVIYSLGCVFAFAAPASEERTGSGGRGGPPGRRPKRRREREFDVAARGEKKFYGRLVHCSRLTRDGRPARRRVYIVVRVTVSNLFFHVSETLE